MPDAGFTTSGDEAWRIPVARLAGLDPFDYDRERTEAAKRLGVRTSVLDAEVQKLRRAAELARDDNRPPVFTDEALALRFTADHGDRLRYVASWNKWFFWDGVVWRREDTKRVFDLSRAVCRAASAECNDDKIARAVASASTVAAIERLAQADRQHAARTDEWDADPWLLNTPGGVVDLRTGRMQRHQQSDLMTKMTAVAPGGDIPVWLAFLNRITCDNVELRAFIQRIAGYALTGITREHALFFGYGTGANGKGVLLNTLTGLLRDYAIVAPMETLMASGQDRHSTELAMLRGARLVTAQETEEGRQWAEARVKALTGGDPITARFMRQDFFTFQPQFKLFIAGNHKPALRNVDEAIRRRFNLIPLTAQIPAVDRDTELTEKLKAEWPGILQWAIEGCLAWQSDGLMPPKAVTDATADYFDAEDGMKAWLDECCDVEERYVDGSTALYESFRRWSERAGERPLSQKRFSQAMQARGHDVERTRTGIKIGGVRLKPRADRSQLADDLP